MHRLGLTSIGQIPSADLEFGDLTVLVGPQASGKSITLQWLKLLNDFGLIQEQLQTYGIDYKRELREFLEVYFGEGMASIWGSQSQLAVDGAPIDLKRRLSRKQAKRSESVFLIPAQRVMALANGWPRPFTNYSAGDPYCVRAYSEELRLLMEREFAGSGPLFPKSNRLKAGYRTLLQQTVFADFSLKVDRSSVQKRLVLEHEGNLFPYMVWSAGQREFVPLLLGLYWLMPPGKTSRRDQIEWVIIEELEMGLHPRAISIVLLIALELLARGYRVCLSTHSPQVLELAWTLNTLRKRGGTPEALLKLFGAPKSPELKIMAASAIQKECRVYYFEAGKSAVDITSLDPQSELGTEASWGGLLEFSARANEIVADTVANGPTQLDLIPGSTEE